MRACCVAVLLILTGCATVAAGPFSLKKELPLQDQSVVQPDLAKRHFSKLIVLRPSGSDSSNFEDQVASFEREFMREGVTVISGAVTGRVLLDDRKPDTAAMLTDIQRALMMARGSGAEAILQIGGYHYVERIESRYLVYDEKAGFREVGRTEYAEWTGSKHAVTSGALRFAGRLVDVSSGEVLASFNVVCASSWSLPADVIGQMSIDMSGAWSAESNFALFPVRRWDASRNRYDEEQPEWDRKGSARCNQRITERLIRVTLSRGVPASASSSGTMLEL